MQAISLLRLPDTVSRYGKSKSTIYAEIERGLFPPQIAIGPRIAAWPSDEVEAVIRARIAGKDEDEIRALVRRMVDGRSQAANATAGTH